MANLTFSEALVAALNAQRRSRLVGPQRGLCDVVVRSGCGVTTHAHSAVLASASKFCEEKLLLRSEKSPMEQAFLDLSKLFRGIEDLMPVVVDSLYTGVQVVSPDAGTDSLLASAYEGLQLQLPFVKAKPIIPTQQLVTSSNNNNNNNEAEASMDLSICPVCNMLFVSREEFLAHTKLKCSRKLTCYTCGKLFTRVQGLANHLVDVRHGETVCSICGHEGDSQRDAEAHIGKHAANPEQPYFCVVCDLRFSTRKKWEKHLPKHSSEAPFECKECGKAFKWKHALTAHAVVHSAVKKFLCQECGFSTSHVSTFRFHNRMHSGNLMRCDVKSCTFQTTRKSNLVQHKLTHSKEKPHQCEICGRSFSLAKNMRRHARQHDTNATIYRCKVNSCIFKSLRSDKYVEHVKKYHPDEAEEEKTDVVSTTTPVVTLAVSDFGPAISVTTTPSVAPSLLTSSPFNTVSPPNKTVSDTYDANPFPDTQFDEAMILAATDEDITNLVVVPLM